MKNIYFPEEDITENDLFLITTVRLITSLHTSEREAILQEDSFKKKQPIK